jgi:tetratricopeptide (TPR) repeat protein
LRRAACLIQGIACTLLPVQADGREGGHQIVDATAEERARAHIQKAADAFQDGRYDEAMTEFEAGYAAVPRPGFVLNMGHVQRKAGNLERARDYYRRYLQLEPKSPQRAEVEKEIAEIDVALRGRAGGGATRTTPPARKNIVLTPAQDDAEEPAGLKAIPAKAIVASPPQSQESPFYQRWWFWGTAGGLVVAGAIAFFVIRSRGDDYSASGTWGTLGK